MTRAQLLQQLEDAIAAMRTAADAITADPTESRWKVDIVVELAAIQAMLAGTLLELRQKAETQRDLFESGRFKEPLSRVMTIIEEATATIARVNEAAEANLTVPEKAAAGRRR